MSNTQMLPKSATNQQPQAVANNITITHKEYAVLLNERANLYKSTLRFVSLNSTFNKSNIL